MKPISRLIITMLPFLCLLAAGPSAQAVVPPPDGGYPNFTTAEGTNALQNLTTGAGNTGVGWRSLFSNAAANFNTGLGAGTLVLNAADSNTAVGAAALLLNTTGTENTAVGTAALVYNDSGNSNTADGAFALSSNTTGNYNTANGFQALRANLVGIGNTASGYNALYFNADGDYNTANGLGTLFNNIGGGQNTAVGYLALYNNTSGFDNVGIGWNAGSNLTTGSYNICIGANVTGMAGDHDTTRIRNIYSSAATARQVYVNADDKIGTLSSSRRYKEEIEPMDQASETLFALKPVTFRYKKEIDPARMLSFGLIAEDVAKISPDLITLDKEGRPYSVRYDQVNAMLLNEFLKEHRKVEQQGEIIAKQQKQIEAFTAGLQRVSDQIEMRRSGPQVLKIP